MGNVYLLFSTDERNCPVYKIGKTKRDPNKRLKELSTGNPNGIVLVKTFKSKWMNNIETTLHKLFASKKKDGEWFSLSDDDVRLFEDNCKKIHDRFNNY